MFQVAWPGKCSADHTAAGSLGLLCSSGSRQAFPKCRSSLNADHPSMAVPDLPAYSPKGWGWSVQEEERSQVFIKNGEIVPKAGTGSLRGWEAWRRPWSQLTPESEETVASPPGAPRSSWRTGITPRWHESCLAFFASNKKWKWGLLHLFSKEHPTFSSAPAMTDPPLHPEDLRGGPAPIVALGFLISGRQLFQGIFKKFEKSCCHGSFNDANQFSGYPLQATVWWHHA